MKLKELINKPSLVLEARTFQDIYAGIDKQSLDRHFSYMMSDGFSISNNKLTSLFGCTFDEVHDKVDISNNKLRTLEHCPKIIKGKFDCSHNRLTTLEHGPLEVEGEYKCEHNHLTSLLGAPLEFKGGKDGSLSCTHNDLTDLTGLENVKNLTRLDCSDNELTSLKGAPATLNMLNCKGNRLTSLEGLHNVHSLDCSDNKLISLKGIHHIIKKAYSIDVGGNYITSHVLGLLKIEGLKYAYFGLGNKLKPIENIINKHLEGNVNGCNLEACADELCDEGFEEYAQL